MESFNTNPPITIKLALNALVKGILVGVLIAIVIAEMRLSYIVGGCLIFMALLNNKNPFYLGLPEKKVRESRIIYYGLPFFVSVAILIGCYKLLITYF